MASLIKKSAHFIIYRLVMKNFLRIIFGISYKNTAHLKNQKQFIIVANHNSHMDTVSILSALPTTHLTRVHPVAAGDYFGRNKITAMLTHFFINTLLIDRKKTDSKRNALDEMDSALKSGDSLLIFPEGSRGAAEVMQDFKHGASILLKRNPEIPFIPIFLKGMGKALPKGEKILVPMECQVRIGRAIFINDIQNKEVPEITEIIKDSILKLQRDEV